MLPGTRTRAFVPLGISRCLHICTKGSAWQRQQGLSGHLRPSGRLRFTRSCAASLRLGPPALALHLSASCCCGEPMCKAHTFLLSLEFCWGRSMAWPCSPSCSTSASAQQPLMQRLGLQQIRMGQAGQAVDCSWRRLSILAASWHCPRCMPAVLPRSTSPQLGLAASPCCAVCATSVPPTHLSLHLPATWQRQVAHLNSMQSLSSQGSRRLLSTTSTRPSGSFLQPGTQEDGSTPDWQQQQRRQAPPHMQCCAVLGL